MKLYSAKLYGFLIAILLSVHCSAMNNKNNFDEKSLNEAEKLSKAQKHYAYIYKNSYLTCIKSSNKIVAKQCYHLLIRLTNHCINMEPHRKKTANYYECMSGAWIAGSNLIKDMNH